MWRQRKSAVKLDNDSGGSGGDDDDGDDVDDFSEHHSRPTPASTLRGQKLLPTLD